MSLLRQYIVKASGGVDRAQAFTPCARLSADNQFRQFRGQTLHVVQATVSVVAIAAVAVLHPRHAGLQAFPVVHATDVTKNQ